MSLWQKQAVGKNRSFLAEAKFLVSYLRFWGEIAQSGKNVSGIPGPGSYRGKFKMATQMGGPTTLGSPRFCLEKSHSQPMWFRWPDHIITAWNWSSPSMSTCYHLATLYG